MTKRSKVPSVRTIATDPELKALKPAQHAIDYRDDEQPGLVIRVLPSGVVGFTVRYRFKGKQRRLKLGDYPAVTLAEARKRARKEASAIDDNRDPVAERRAAKTAGEDTIANLAALYLKRHARPKKRTADEDERVLEVEVIPRWGDRCVKDIRRRDVRELLDRIVDRGSPIMANRILSVIRKMLNFALDQDWIEANPATRMSKPGKETSRDRVLDDQEIRRVWRVLTNLPTTEDRPAPGRSSRRGQKTDDPVCPVSAPLAAMLRVRLLTAQRGGEVSRIRWCDVDLDTGWWTIPAADAKNGEQHRVPLTPTVINIIKAQKVDGRDVAAEAFVFIGSGASIRDRAKKAPAEIARLLEIDFRGHDLRRTAATRMAEAGIPRDHIAHVLNHVEGGARATRVYDRHNYDREKRIALEAWDRALTRILAGKQNSNIVTMAR